MRLTTIGALILSSILAVPSLLYGQDKIRDSVVKIHAVRRDPDLVRPWTKRSPKTVNGSGVVIDGKLILTNAHVVRYASQIYVQPNQSADKLVAHVVASAPPIDLALLRLEDESFFDRRDSLSFAEELPAVRDTVNVYGYPTGGTELSVTEGIISRIEFTHYQYFTMGLRIQVDAALNPGNSGGPAVSHGRLVGLVFSHIPSAQNIGYLIPVEEIRMFLEDIRDGNYDGKPQIFDDFQTVENDALRKRLGLPKGITGMMVAEPYRSDGTYPLKEWDVITHIGDQPIDSEGKMALRYDLRVSALYLVQKLAKNGRIELTVRRQGQAIKVDLAVPRQREFVVPFLMSDNPRYFIYGPFVFSQATHDYLKRLGSKWESFLIKQASPLLIRRYDKPAFEGEELVVVCSPMFPHRLTKGYDDPNTSVLKEVNGIPVRNLRHLVEILRDTEETQIVFKFARKAVLGQETLVFNRDDITAATEEILNDNGIRYQHSADIRAVWEKPRAN
jgi:S1-C subfamily serine protease